MSIPSRSIKTAALALLIALGALMLASRAEARDIKTMVVAGGCFWCIESDFERVNGVTEVVSGYSGGSTVNPTYDTLKGSGHYEVVQITYDADQVSYRQLLDLFFRSVDPTDAGGQFCDRGDTYRTAVFVSNTGERSTAQAAKSAAQSALGQTIVTPIINAAPFYEAEDYHQNYYKSSERVITRRGIKTKADAYKFYRDACGRDQRVRQLWGANAPFINH